MELLIVPIVILLGLLVLLALWAIIENVYRFLDKVSLDTANYTEKGIVIRQNYVAAYSTPAGKSHIYRSARYSTTFKSQSSGREYTVNDESLYHAAKRGSDIIVTVTNWLRPDGTTKYEEVTHYEIL